MLTLNVAAESLRTNQVHRFATLWMIERVDGTIFRFTDHDAEITDEEGNTYEPAGGFDATARERVTGTEKSPNLEVVGIVNSDAITEADLRAGHYRHAQVNEWLIDWRYPWLGRTARHEYRIMETKFSTNGWEAQLQGKARQLRQAAGRIAQRRCPYDLGQPITADGPGLTGGCGVTLASFTVSGTVTDIEGVPVGNSLGKRAFSDTGLASTSDNWYRHGVLTWTSGDNNGLSFEVQGYTDSSRRVLLWLETPELIQVGDTFDMYAGCDKERTTCRDKFSNIANFGGLPWVPGGKKANRTPNIPD